MWNCPLSLDDLKVHDFDRQKLLDFTRTQGFKTMSARIEGQMEGGAAPTPEPEAAPEPGKAEYELVQDEAALQAWVERAVEAGAVAVDTETTSLDAAAAKLVGICLSTAPGNGCYIPVGHTGAQGEGTLALDDNDGAPPQIDFDRAIAILKPMLEDPSVLKIGQNLKYDYHILAKHGIRLDPIDDTMLISYVLDGGAHGHGMDDLAELHLGHTTVQVQRHHRQGEEPDHLRPGAAATRRSATRRRMPTSPCACTARSSPGWSGRR